MPAFHFQDVRLVTPTGVFEGGELLTDEAGHIARVGNGDGPLSPAPELVDGRGLTLLPGFVDVHCHGGGGADTMDAIPNALQAICRTHARHGTTGLLLTTITQSREKTGVALGAARAAWEAGPTFCADGAQVLGVHLEGPYLCAAKAGAQPREFVRPYDAAEFAEWLALSGGAIKLITLAPEQPGASELIAAARGAGIVVSVGHTDASADQARGAIEAGARHATHLFNAMPPLHHRAPGPVAAFLLDARVRTEIIADGFHVDPDIARLVFTLKGEAGVVLITDAIAGTAMGDGVYDLGGHPVTVASNRATLADGTLAGSVLTMDRAAANARAWADLGWESLVRATSTNAADTLGLTGKGRLAPGADADLVLVDDALTVHATFVAGRCVFRR